MFIVSTRELRRNCAIAAVVAIFAAGGVICALYGGKESEHGTGAVRAASATPSYAIGLPVPVIAEPNQPGVAIPPLTAATGAPPLVMPESFASDESPPLQPPTTSVFLPIIPAAQVASTTAPSVADVQQHLAPASAFGEGGVQPVPEPATWAMLISGLLMAVRRLRASRR